MRPVAPGTLFDPYRIAEPARNGDKTCWVFAWIGQSFETCEMCGRPVREHLYHPPYAGQRTLFRVKQYRPWRDEWFWQPVGSFVKSQR